MSDWQTYVEWPSDLNRAGTMSASLLHNLPRPSPTADLQRLFIEATVCVYMVPEGQTRWEEDSWAVRLAEQALAGDSTAGGQVGAYYLQHARSGQDVEARVAYGALLSAFLLAQRIAAPALKLLGGAFGESCDLPVPRMIEMQSLLWCIAMHGVHYVHKDDANEAFIPLSLQVRQAIDKILQRRDTSQEPNTRSVLWATHQLHGVLFSCIGSTFATAYGQPSEDIVDNSRGLAQKVQEYTQNRWPAVSWVSAFHQMQSV